MNPIRPLAILLLTTAAVAHAAPAPYLVIDNSSATLMDANTAQVLWNQHRSAKFDRLYPSKRWGMVSEVEGGFDDKKACIVTARAMLLPRSGKALVYRPYKTSTAFGTQAAASLQQCKALAQTKLSEAIGAVSSALLAE